MQTIVAGIKHRIRAITDTIAVWTAGLGGSLWSAVALTAEIRDNVLKVDSHVAVHNTRIFPPMKKRKSNIISHSIVHSNCPPKFVTFLLLYGIILLVLLVL